MLSIFIPPIIIPNISDQIQVFHDHLNPLQFYYLNSNIRLAKDAETGKHMFNYMFIARNANQVVHATGEDVDQAVDSAWAQRGRLTLTTCLALTEDEEAKIRFELKKLINSSSYAENTVRLYYPEQYNSYKKIPNPVSQIKLSCVPFVDGNVKISTIDGEKDEKPSLTGHCNALFSMPMENESSESMYRVLTQVPEGMKGTEDRNISTGVTVWYNMNYRAHFPFKVSATIDLSSVYLYLSEVVKKLAEIKYEYRRVRRVRRYSGRPVIEYYYEIPPQPVKKIIHEIKPANIRPNTSATNTKIERLVQEAINLENKILNLAGSDVLANDEGVYLSKEAMNLINAEVCVKDCGIKIEIGDDYTLNEEDKQLNETITSTIINMVTNTIIPMLFNNDKSTLERIKDEMNDASEDDNSSEDENSDSKNNSANKKPYYYSLRKDASSISKETFNINLTKSSSIVQEFNPQGQIEFIANKKTIKDYITEIDATNPSNQILKVPINVYADFDKDEVAEIDVYVLYKQKDKSGLVRTQNKSYVFKDANKTTYFLATMARAKDGSPIETYQYKTKIIYKGRKSQTENGGWSNLKTVENGEPIALHYAQLGSIDVTCMTGDIDWTLIKEVFVTFEYDKAKGKEDTSARIKFIDGDDPKRWNCFKYGNESDEYSYSVKYIYVDGSEEETKHKTSSSSSLVIDDLFTGSLGTVFDISSFGESIGRVKVEVLYEDTKYKIHKTDSNWFESPGTWSWTMRVHEGANNTFKYRTTVQYNDGTTETSDWSKPFKNGENINVLGGSNDVKLWINGLKLDWNEWQFVYVKISYDDDKNNVHFKKDIRITEDSAEADIIVHAPESDTPFNYNISYVPNSGKEVEVSGETNKNYLILNNLLPPSTNE